MIIKMRSNNIRFGYSYLKFGYYAYKTLGYQGISIPQSIPYLISYLRLIFLPFQYLSCLYSEYIPWWWKRKYFVRQNTIEVDDDPPHTSPITSCIIGGSRSGMICWDQASGLVTALYIVPALAVGSIHFARGSGAKRLYNWVPRQHM
jgi:hypothetical protein